MLVGRLQPQAERLAYAKTYSWAVPRPRALRQSGIGSPGGGVSEHGRGATARAV